MCEFMATPLSGARQGNPKGAKRRGAFSFDTFFGASKESIKKGFKKVSVHFFVQHKETNQRKAAPGVSRPPTADSLDGHMIAGSP
jgi:hypothetical protein